MNLAIDTLEEKKLYKFRSIPRDSVNPGIPKKNKLHYIERIFTECELHFPSPTELNDPFESRLNLVVGDLRNGDYKRKYKQYVKRIILQSNPIVDLSTIDHWLSNQSKEEAENLAKQYTESYREWLSKYRICSFSATPKNPLLWSHYSDSHKGFCLIFDAGTDIFGSALKVDYCDEYPKLDVTEEDSVQILIHSALKKYADWQYEQEYRLISVEPNEPNLLPVANKTYRFHPDLLIGIIFGSQISGSDRELLIDFCKKSRSPIDFKKARLSDTKYELEVVDYAI